MPFFFHLAVLPFSRMFVDAMDAQMYDEHHQSGYCYLSLAKVLISLNCSVCNFVSTCASNVYKIFAF